MATKKAAAKAAEVKEEVKVVEAPVAEKAAEAPKAEAKKPAAKKTAAKKPAAKATAKKAEMQANLFIQYQGAEVSYADLIERAKAEAGVKAPKTVNLYVKPEDNMVYYVVDEKDGGFVLA